MIRNKIWVCDHLVDMHAFQLPCFLNEIKLNEHVWDQIYQTSTYRQKLRQTMRHFCVTMRPLICDRTRKEH